MAQLTRGKTFGATEEVTNSKLHQLVDSATLSSIVQADLAAGTGVVSRGTSAPSDSDQIWIDTSTTIPTVKVNDGTNWVPVAEHNILTNKTGQTTSIGQVVIIDTGNANSFKFTSTEGDTKFRGVIFEAIANNSTQDVIGRGDAPYVLLEVSASAGSFLRTSTATGKANPVGSVAAGVFGITQEAGTASARSYIFGGLGASQSASAASQAEMEAASNTSNPIVPGRAHFHPGSPKAWILFDGRVTGTATGFAKYNVTDVVRDTTGFYTVTFATAFSSNAIGALGIGKTSGSNNMAIVGKASSSASAGKVPFQITLAHTGAPTDFEEVFISFFGDI